MSDYDEHRSYALDHLSDAEFVQQFGMIGPRGEVRTPPIVATSDETAPMGQADYAAWLGLTDEESDAAYAAYRAGLVATDDPCDCSEDDGPCEQHRIIHAQREGASTRTADELALVFIDDLLAIHEATGGLFGGELSAWGADVVSKARAALYGSDHEDDGSYRFSRWIDDADLAQSLHDVAWQCESGSGLWVTHDDGYIIAQVTGGPLSD